MRTFVSSRCVSVGRRRDWRRPGTCSRNASAPSRSPSSLAIQSVDATRSVGGGPRDWSLATNSPVFGARKRSAPWRRSSRTPTCRSKSSKRRAVTCCHGPESVRRGRSAGDPTGLGRCQRMPGTAAGQPRIRGCRSTSAAGGPVRSPVIGQVALVIAEACGLPARRPVRVQRSAEQVAPVGKRQPHLRVAGRRRPQPPSVTWCVGRTDCSELRRARRLVTLSPAGRSATERIHHRRNRPVRAPSALVYSVSLSLFGVDPAATGRPPSCPTASREGAPAPP